MTMARDDEREVVYVDDPYWHFSAGTCYRF